MPKDLLLGTAMWGWTTSPLTAYAMLDAWYAAGFRRVDAATNYPINKIDTDFRRSENILAQWINAHGIRDLQVLMKFGSINNQMTPEHLLHASFQLITLDYYQHLFEDNLHTWMVHWDNRTEKAAIEDTFVGFAEAKKRGLQLGLSGIQSTNLYAAVNENHTFEFDIQIKHNLLVSDYERYAPFHKKARFLAYGMNAGGIKLDGQYAAKSSLVARGRKDLDDEAQKKEWLAIVDKHNRKFPSAKIDAFYQLGMTHAWHHPDMHGMLVGPSNTAQLNTTLAFAKVLDDAPYIDLAKTLQKI